MKRKSFFNLPRLLIVALAGACACPIPGQETPVATRPITLTLEQAISVALQDNPELKASGGKVEAAAGRAMQARTWSNPELEVSAEDWPLNSGGIGNSKSLVGVAQTLPFPGKKKLDRQIGGAHVRVSEAERSFRRIELVRDVKAAFFQVLAAERLVDVATELVKVAASAATTARKRTEAGDTARQEQLRAEMQWEQAQTEQAGFQRELGLARHKLVALMGRPELKEPQIAGTLSESVNLALLAQGPEQWLARHPSMVAAKTNRERAGMEPYPDVKVGVAGGRDGATDGSIVEFRISLPLPILDRSKGRQQEARANLTIADAELAVVEQRLLREWDNASQRLRTAASQVTHYRERLLPKAQEALRLVQIGFEQGKFGFIDWLDTQRTTAEARLVYQQKLLDLNIARAEIEALVTDSPGEASSAQPQTKP